MSLRYYPLYWLFSHQLIYFCLKQIHANIYQSSHKIIAYHPPMPYYLPSGHHTAVTQLPSMGNPKKAAEPLLHIKLFHLEKREESGSSLKANGRYRFFQQVNSSFYPEYFHFYQWCLTPEMSFRIAFKFIISGFFTLVIVLSSLSGDR